MCSFSAPSPRKNILRVLTPPPLFTPTSALPPARALSWLLGLMRAAGSFFNVPFFGSRQASTSALSLSPSPWQSVIIHTDGSFHPRGSRMGWGAVFAQSGAGEGTVLGILSGGARGGNSNKAEANAVVEALESLPLTTKEVVLFTDCQRVVYALRRALSKGSVSHDAGRSGLSAPMFARLHAATLGRQVEFHWERGHDGNFFNEAADILAGFGSGEHIPNHPSHHAHLVRARAAALARLIEA